MLTIREKIVYFEQRLLFENKDYRDIIKEEIYNYFFIYLGDSSNIENFSFLDEIKSKEKIDDKLNFIISKIIMHEHQAGIEDLINEYI